MSWFARSLVNSLRGDGNEGSHQRPSVKEGSHESSGIQVHADDEPLSPSRSVKEDLSELTKTITRQFWGVASFLAPPPDIPSNRSRLPDPTVSDATGDSDEKDAPVSPRITGIRSDFAELGGRFKSGISMLSNTKAVSEISKIASTFLPFGDDDAEEEVEEEEGGELDGVAVGITEDVMLFVRNILMHPETWLDFPVLSEDEDSDEFKMSDTQQKHGLAVERLEPRLAALRIELCPSHMSEGCFWKIYFVLLHSRLNKHDAELLSTTQIMKAREMLLVDLHSRAKPNAAASAQGSHPGNDDEQDDPAVPDTYTINTFPTTSIVSSQSLPPPPPPPSTNVSASIPIVDIETEKHPVETTVVAIVDKSVTDEDPPVQAKGKELLQANVSRFSEHRDEGNEDDWLDDETIEASGSGENVLPLGNDEEVSFSDLEEDDDHAASKSAPARVKESTGWVQLNSNSASRAKIRNSANPQNKDDWLNVDGIDVE